MEFVLSETDIERIATRIAAKLNKAELDDNFPYELTTSMAKAMLKQHGYKCNSYRSFQGLLDRKKITDLGYPNKEKVYLKSDIQKIYKK